MLDKLRKSIGNVVEVPLMQAIKAGYVSKISEMSCNIQECCADFAVLHLPPTLLEIGELSAEILKRATDVGRDAVVRSDIYQAQMQLSRTFFYNQFCSFEKVLFKGPLTREEKVFLEGLIRRAGLAGRQDEIAAFLRRIEEKFPEKFNELIEVVNGCRG